MPMVALGARSSVRSVRELGTGRWVCNVPCALGARKRRRDVSASWGLRKRYRRVFFVTNPTK